MDVKICESERGVITPNRGPHSTFTHTHITFSGPLPVDFPNTHAHERSLREVNNFRFLMNPVVLFFTVSISY